MCSIQKTVKTKKRKMGKLTEYIAYINGNYQPAQHKHYFNHFTIDENTKKVRKLLKHPKMKTAEQILDNYPILDGVLISDHEIKAVHLAMKEYAIAALEEARSRIHKCRTVEFAQYEIEKIKSEIK